VARDHNDLAAELEPVIDSIQEALGSPPDEAGKSDK
jgi:hypothetical protein